MTPLYLADMMSLKESNLLEWEYLKTNFSICESEIPYTIIESDHVMKWMERHFISLGPNEKM